tara:strand:+ start:1094 stop:1888 length:795 start_codon:yes stop_codon:yes gene_type:complete
MARKVLVQRNNTIGTWKSKTQQMSDFIGDLDDLGPAFDSNPFFPPPDTRQDSSLVAALNSMGGHGDEIHELFFEAKRVMPKPVTANFHVDSGSFRNILRVDRLANNDDAMPGPNFNQNDKPFWLGDSPGTAAFDFTADSVHINRLHVGNFLDVNDSAFIYDRVQIGGLRPPHDSTNTADIDSAKIVNLHVVDMHSDIGRVTGNLDLDDALFSNSFTATKSNFNELAINQLRMDGDGYVGLVKPFRIEDENGANRFGAYFLDDSS